MVQSEIPTLKILALQILPHSTVNTTSYMKFKILFLRYYALAST